MNEVLKKIAVSKDWWYFGRNFSHPGLDTLSCCIPANTGDFAKAAEVFREMNIDLFELSQIFMKEPWNYYTKLKNKRKVQLTAASYEAMGCCRAMDEEGWRKLAALTGKVIHFLYGHGDGEYDEIAVYHPDGRMMVPREKKSGTVYVRVWPRKKRLFRRR
jgi:hypothetical protein